jgi:predicted O-methyltransferase YrrM
LLKKIKNEYHNGPAAKKFLSSQSPHCMLPKISHSLAGSLDWTTLVEKMKSKKSMSTSSWEASPRKAEAFTRAMDSNGTEKADAVAKACDLKNLESMIDIGGAAGAFSLAFRKSNPNLKITLFEHPLTNRAARKILKEKGYKKIPLRTVDGDFLSDPLGGPFDAALLSNILHIYDEQTNLKLLKKVRTALNPGGTVIIHDFLLNAQKDSPLYAAMFSVHMLVHTNNGRSYSGEELKVALKEAGFEKVKIMRDVTESSGVVMGIKQ